MWRRGGQILSSGSRVNISTITTAYPSIYGTTLSISPLSNTLDSGQYSCQSVITSEPYILYTDASQQISVRIGGIHIVLQTIDAVVIVVIFFSELPIPAINVVSDGNSIAGENYTLTCSVTVIDGLEDDALIAASWFDGRGNPVQPDSVQTDNVNTTLTLQFNPILSSHGGPYACNATVTIPEISAARSNSQLYDVIVQGKDTVNLCVRRNCIVYLLLVPSPNIVVMVSQPEPYLAGMFAELRCSISLDDAIDTRVAVAVLWQRDGEELNETVRVRKLPPQEVGSSRYDALLQFSTLSSTIDSGNYMCVGTVSSTANRNYITNSSGTTPFLFSVTGK